MPALALRSLGIASLIPRNWRGRWGCPILRFDPTTQAFTKIGG